MSVSVLISAPASTMMVDNDGNDRALAVLGQRQRSHQAIAPAMALPHVNTAPPPLRWLRLGRSEATGKGNRRAR